MMGQYLRLKASQPGAILFFRLGDFYEMFAEDAEQAAPILDIALTRRNGVPMCGVPHHAAQTYLTKLLRAGRKVAICEQVGVPEGGLTERRVVEVVTPGTIVDERLLDHASNNYLAAVADAGTALGLAWADLSTGELRATRLPAERTELWLRDHMQRLAPRELIVQESLLDAGSPAERVLAERPDLVLDRYPDWHFEPDANHEILCRQFGVVDLRSFGLQRTDAEVRAAGALVGFIRQHALHDTPHLHDLVVEAVDANLRIDEPTQRNLELTANLLDGGREHTLLATLDRTRTSVGARLLRRSVLAPLRERDSIERRLDDVEGLFRNQALLSRVRAELDRFRDLERLTARSSLGRSDARELLAIRTCLQCALTVAEVLADTVPRLAAALHDRDGNLAALLEALRDALCDASGGPAFRAGHSADLDRLQAAATAAERELSRYADEVRTETGIASVRLKHNRVLGYFFDITKPNLDRVPGHFIRRQSLANSERFTTERLMDLDARIGRAQADREELERAGLIALRQQVASHSAALLRLAAAVAEVDLVQSLATAATELGYTRPTFVDEDILEIRGGRHPVVEAAMPSGAFIPNGIDLGTTERVVLLTGPNMAGKSTYLRQTALIAIMGHVGSFVPAEQARLGVVDAVYCRVGASDNISRGESTFLVEMAETARILRLARPTSVVIMDEIGRGTGSDDGLAIARAVLEHLLQVVHAKALFATHFRELTALQHPQLVNRSMAVMEGDGDVVFLKTVVDGPADRSHGIHVARMAGIPGSVSDLAARYLEDALAVDRAPPAGPRAATELPPQPHLFDPRQPDGSQPGRGAAVIDELLRLDLGILRPIDALNLLHEWQQRVR